MAQTTARPASPRRAAPLSETLSPLLTVEEVSALGLASKATVRKMCATGEIFAVKTKCGWRINRDALLADLGLK